MFTAKEVKAIVSKMKAPLFVQLNGRHFLQDANNVFTEYVSVNALQGDNAIMIRKDALVKALAFMDENAPFVVQDGRLNGESVDFDVRREFPSFGVENHTIAFETDKKALGALVKGVGAFTSTDLYRTNMMAVLFSAGSVYATNGHYLMTAPFPIANDVPRFYVSKSALVLAEKIAEKGDTVQVSINMDEIEGSRTVSISVDNKTIVTREEREFPNAERLIDETVNGVSFESTKEFADYVKAGAKHYKRLDVTIEEGKVTVAFSDGKKSTRTDLPNGGRSGFKSFTTSTKGFEALGRDRMSVVLDSAYVTKLLGVLGANATILLKYYDAGQYAVPVNFVGKKDQWAVLMPIRDDAFDYRLAE